MAEQRKHVPFVSSETRMAEFTLRGLIIGIILAVVLGSANAYLGLKAGMTIAATYPAAVIGMAILRIFKGTILEENFTRTVGSIGESVAAGAIFTLPAFFISGIWEEFYTPGHYLISSLIMLTGGVLGIMFVALLRRVMANDATLPFPESLAAAEIHKTGQTGSGSKYLFWAMGIGALIKSMGEFRLFMPVYEKFIQFKTQFITGAGEAIKAKGGILLGSPGLKPAYIGVGYIIGPKLASLTFSGGVIAWGLLTPLAFYFVAPFIDLQAWGEYLVQQDLAVNMKEAMATVESPMFQITEVWKTIVRPIAIGGMLVGTFWTLWGMRKSLTQGISRSVEDLKKSAAGSEATERIEKDISFLWIMIGIILAGIATFLIATFIFDASFMTALIATLVMIIFGFFFAAVSGYLVGIIGSSNNPISGLTIST
ncbi:MAG: OPT family oligopeptide transporter, partial [Bacteroidales bacterium]